MGKCPCVVSRNSRCPAIPAATAECLAAGSNIDFRDIDTLKWISATDAKALSDVSFLLTVGAIGAPAGAAAFLSGGSSAAGLLSGYMKGEFPEALSREILSSGFQKYAIARGIPEDVAGRLTNSLSAAGVWKTLVDNGIGIFVDE